MTNNEPISDLIDILERRRLMGIKYIQLSSENRAFLQNLISPHPPDNTPVRTNDTSKYSKRPPTSVIPVPPSADRSENSELLIPPRDVDKSMAPSPRDFGPIAAGNRIPSIAELSKTIAVCGRCRLGRSRTQAVGGTGNLQAKLMFIGDGPTRADDSTGTLYSDEAGDLLDRIMKAMQFSRKDVYLTTVTRCCPATRRPADDDEAQSCLPYLQREIELIRPEVIVLLGPLPLKHLLNEDVLSKVRGRWMQYQGIHCIATYHPSYLIRVPAAKRDVWNDMQKVMSRLAKKTD